MMFAAITIKVGLGGLLLLPFWIGAIGWLSSRILGIHLGRWRAGIAAFLGWIVGLTAAALVVGGDTTVPDWIIIVLVIFFGVLAALPFAIVLDLITRSTGAPRRGRRRPIKAIHAAIAPLGRFREVVHNARKENLVSPRYRSAAALSTPDFARRLKAVLEDSGGMFVKFGQIASTRTDLLPTTLTDELETLQSDVRPEPPEAIRTQLERELNEPVEKAFASFTI